MSYGGLWAFNVALWGLGFGASEVKIEFRVVFYAALETTSRYHDWLFRVQTSVMFLSTEAMCIYVYMYMQTLCSCVCLCDCLYIVLFIAISILVLVRM